MRKFAMIAILAGTTALAGCATTGGTTVTPASVASEVTAIFTQVERYVATACSALPELASVIALANAGVAVGVASLGGAFCSAFQSAVPAIPPASARKRFAARHGRRFGAASGTLGYYCAGSICGWK